MKLPHKSTRRHTKAKDKITPSPLAAEHPEVKRYKKHAKRTRITLLLAYFVAGIGLLVAVWGVLTAVNYSDALSNGTINQPNLVGVVLPLPSNHISNIKAVTWKGGTKDSSVASSPDKTLTITVPPSQQGSSLLYTTQEMINGDFDYLVDWSVSDWCKTPVCEVPVGVVATSKDQDERITVGLTNSPVPAVKTVKYINGIAQPATYAEMPKLDSSVLLARRGNQIITYYVKDGAYTFLAKQAVSGECCKLIFGARNQSADPLSAVFTKFEVRQ